MREWDMNGRRDAVVAAVVDLEAKLHDAGLLSVGVAIRSVAESLEVNDTTTRKDIAVLVADGRLVEVSHAERRLAFPWPAQVANAPVRWVNGAVKSGCYEVAARKASGTAMKQVRFLFTPERLDLMMERIGQEAEQP